ncbi:MAG: hypothetical protein K5787_12830 [Lentisphaeria bacterium]|nr:hypothetical protein [Lentisphaeria bacterium]
MKNTMNTILAVTVLFIAAITIAAPSASAETAVKKTCVEAHSVDRYEREFVRGEQALVIVSGNGDTDLDLYIYDENGELVASDTDDSDQCVASWMPRRTGCFTIKVVNHGSIFNSYTIGVNGQNSQQIDDSKSYRPFENGKQSPHKTREVPQKGQQAPHKAPQVPRKQQQTPRDGSKLV